MNPQTWEKDVVEIEPGVWRVKSTGQVFRQGERGTYPSKEMRPWACRTTGQPIRCFFFLGGAT